MKDKKHIDKLFKDRFKDFEASPSPEVWGSIQASLESRKKNRKIIPLFWKVGGVAALLALLFTIGNSIYNASEVDSSIVTIDEASEQVESINKKSPLIKENQIGNVNVANEEHTTTSNDELVKNGSEISATDDDTYNSDRKEPNYIKDTKVVTTGNSEKVATKSNNTIKVEAPIVKKQKEAVAVVSEKQNALKNTDKEAVGSLNINESLLKKEIDNSEITNSKVAAAETKNKEAVNSIDEKSSILDPINNQNTVISEEVVAVTSEKQNNFEKTLKNTGETLNPNESLIKKEIQISETTDTEAVATEKKSILDAIDEQNAIKAGETVTVDKDKIDNPWEVAPNFAPVYYSSLNEGSSIDPSFSDNSQSGDVNFSYGVQVSYAISERLSLRSGISNVDLSYSTGGIELGTGPVSAALSSINYDGRQNVLTVLDEGTIEAQNAANGGFGTITQKSTNGPAELIQDISYYEVPLELKYAVVKSKIGVNLIGGMSTMFLGNNGVSVTAGDFSSTLGEANNLSSVSFTTNVGLGVDYKISRKFKFNVEPMFKYQLNPYSDSSVDFQPYYIGVYTGLSYKF